VTLRGVSAAYDGGPVLREIDLHVAAGEILSLLGPSGCGKTTLLRVIAGLHPVEAGTIEFGDRIVSSPGGSVAPEHRRVGMVFQDGALFPHLTVAENVGFGISREPNVGARVGEVLDLVGLADLADRRPATLSGGQQQRVALARALAPRPSILLLDEPFSALDSGLRVQLRREVRRILVHVGITVITVTHDQDEAFSFGDRVAVMRDGVIAQVGRPDELYERPNDCWVANFVGDANLVRGTANGRAATTLFGPLPLDPGSAITGDAWVLVRPEQLRLVAGSRAIIEAVEYFGHDAIYSLSLGGERIEVRVAGSDFDVGDRVDVAFVGSSVAAFPAAG